MRRSFHFRSSNRFSGSCDMFSGQMAMPHRIAHVLFGYCTAIRSHRSNIGRLITTICPILCARGAYCVTSLNCVSSVRTLFVCLHMRIDDRTQLPPLQCASHILPPPPPLSLYCVPPTSSSDLRARECTQFPASSANDTHTHIASVAERNVLLSVYAAVELVRRLWHRCGRRRRRRRLSVLWCVVCYVDGIQKGQPARLAGFDAEPHASETLRLHSTSSSSSSSAPLSDEMRTGDVM